MNTLSELEKLVLEYPNKEWDWYFLSHNDNISYEFIKDHPDLPWDMERVMYNANIDWDNIVDNKTLWKILFKTPDSNLFVQELNAGKGPGKGFGDTVVFMEIGRHEKYITWDDIVFSRDLWEFIDWEILSIVAPIELVLENLHLPWDWESVSYTVGEAIVRKYPKLPWVWSSFSDAVSWEFIQENPDKHWNWSLISLNNNIKNICELIEFGSTPAHWAHWALSKNENITLEFVVSKPNFSWSWEGLSLNKVITWKDFRNNPDRPWVWSKICQNSNVTMDLVKRKPHLPWSYNDLSLNPNITFDFVKENIDKPWDWHLLSQNDNVDMWKVRYNRIKNMNLRLLYFGDFFKYLRMEIFEEMTEFSWFELSHII